MKMIIFTVATALLLSACSASVSIPVPFGHCWIDRNGDRVCN